MTFTDESSGAPTGWSWTFGDGGTSTAQNPSHTYNAAGTYTVSLTASNAHGSDIQTKNGYITVTEPGTGGNTMYVSAMTVGRKVAGPNNNGTCEVSVVDDGGAAVDGANWVLLAALVLGSGIGIFYYLRVVFYMSRAPEDHHLDRATARGWYVRAVPCILIAAILLLGTLPQPLMEYLRSIL